MCAPAGCRWPVVTTRWIALLDSGQKQVSHLGRICHALRTAAGRLPGEGEMLVARTVEDVDKLLARQVQDRVDARAQLATRGMSIERRQALITREAYHCSKIEELLDERAALTVEITDVPDTIEGFEVLPRPVVP